MILINFIRDKARFEIGKVEEYLILAVTKLIAIIDMIVIVFVMVMFVIIP